MRPHTLTIRRLMLAVALVALVAGSGAWIIRMRARSADYRDRAAAYERREIECMQEQVAHGDWNVDTARADQNRFLFYQAEKMAEHSRALKEKWERAAASPWIAAEPDPPDDEEGQP